MQLFTIITITYNAALFLEQTLQSLVSQTFKDYESVIWDGGSTDGTLEILQRYPQLKVFQGKDSGIADAMNRAAAHATGKFLLFLHADDLLASPKALEYLASAVAQYPDTQWFFGRAKIIDEQGAPLRTTPIEYYSYQRLCKYNFLTHPSTLLSRALFEEVGGFDVNCSYCMDYDLWLKVGRKTSPIFLPAILSCFREHTQSTSTSHPIQVTDEAYQIRNRYIRSPLGRWRSYRTWKRRRRALA